MIARDLVLRVLRASPPLWRLKEALRHPSHRGHRLAAVSRVVRYEVNTTMLRRRTVVPLGARSKIRAYPGETNSPQAVARNPPNWPEMLVWRDVLKSGDLFVDVGANIGVYAIWALEQGADVIAVEPNARNADRIRENLALNGYTADVVEKALADRPGVVRMTVGLDSFNHLIVDGETDAVDVEAATLDDLIGDRAAFVKIDVEGAEAFVLRGAVRALSEQRIRLMQLEWDIREGMVAADRSELAELLAEHGYEVRVANSDGLLRAPDPGERLPTNVFVVPGHALVTVSHAAPV